MDCQEITIEAGDMKSFKVDPYHGFIFWIEDSTKLIQLELGCEGQDVQRKVLLDNAQQELGDFTILHHQFKLQVAVKSANALLELDIVSQRSRLATNIK